MAVSRTPAPPRQPSRLREGALFLWKWVQSPARIGAVWPSGANLARAMAAEVDPRGTGAVVELGGGTGPVTRALLQAGIAPERLFVVERDPALARVLARRFPEIRVLVGDAARLGALLAPHGVGEVAVVVSSLPLLSLPPAVKRAILEEVLRLLRPDGILVQFTYGPASPIPRGTVPLRAEPVRRVWRNLPPARVWRYRRAD